MEIAFNEATSLDNSRLEDDLYYCEKHGFDYIEIRLDKLKEYLLTHSVNDLERFFFSSSLKPLSLNALEEFTFRNKTDLALMKEDLALMIEVAKLINCDTIVAVPTFNIEQDWQVIKQETITRLNEFLEVIEQTELNLAIEFVGYPNCSVNTLEQSIEIIETIGHPQLGLVFDCFHFHAMNSSFTALDSLPLEKMFLFHIDDCEEKLPGVLRDYHRLWPGEGVIPLHRIFASLYQKGFKGPVSVEVFRPEYWELEPDECIRIAKEKTIKVIERSFYNL
ncbi:sugar phosphate isomerase/epimerase [Thalassobacillus sp. CUG 92003]|uniref:sugar phosphate isomerase/epimerase family protein n=1 Tax=Thalassobacillus sp. CUG 92003 TaxID=2736641 RepID=UPI0015E74153|nr:sugar phosphate isomerase/epimerase [Thalassobacillus sp. CUG 92003]